MPVMGLFVARISRGRTIRQVICGQVLWGSVGCMTVFGIMGVLTDAGMLGYLVEKILGSKLARTPRGAGGRYCSRDWHAASAADHAGGIPYLLFCVPCHHHQLFRLHSLFHDIAQAHRL